jgi:enoyl-CoA hydratase
MSYETILTEVENGIALITLNRPEVYNAINKQMVDDLHAALDVFEADESVRGLILASSGGKAFMSGADIAEMRERRREDALKGINANLFSRFERFPRPTVAAIAGYCLGGGCELALTCDFRVAGTTSRFGQPEVGLGIMAAAGATRRLPALIGLKNARRLLFSGAIIEVDDAEQMGLVDLVVSDSAVVQGARDLLEPILSQSAEAVKRTKQTLLAWLHGETEEQLLARDNETQADLFEDPEKFRRMDAFLAKREEKLKARKKET